MLITIDVKLDDPLLDLSDCKVIKSTELVEYGDRREPHTMIDIDFNPTYNGYEAVDCDYDYLEALLLEQQ